MCRGVRVCTFKESFYKVKRNFCTGELMEKHEQNELNQRFGYVQNGSASLQSTSCESTDLFQLNPQTKRRCPA